MPNPYQPPNEIETTARGANQHETWARSKFDILVVVFFVTSLSILAFVSIFNEMASRGVYQEVDLYNYFSLVLGVAVLGGVASVILLIHFLALGHWTCCKFIRRSTFEK